MLIAVRRTFRLRRSAANDGERRGGVEIAPASHLARRWRKSFGCGNAEKHVAALLDDAERIVLEDFRQTVQVGFGIRRPSVRVMAEQAGGLL